MAQSANLYPYPTHTSMPLMLCVLGLGGRVGGREAKTPGALKGPVILGWQKSSFGFFCNILWKNLNKFLANPIIPCLVHCGPKHPILGMWEIITGAKRL